MVHRNSFVVLLPRLVRTVTTVHPPSRHYNYATRRRPMAEARSPPTPEHEAIHISKKPRLDARGHLDVSTSDMEPKHDSQVAESSTSSQQASGKQQGKGKNKSKRKQKDKVPTVEPYSTEDVVYRDVQALLGEDVVRQAQEDGSDRNAPFERQQEVELVVSALSSNGEHVFLLNLQTLCGCMRRLACTCKRMCSCDYG